MRRNLGALALVLLVVIVATWPLCRPDVFAGSALGHPYGDLADHYWGTWWFGRELLAGKWPGTTDLSHYPEQLALWYVDPLGALIALALRPLGFPMAWNAMVGLQVLGTTRAAWWVGWRATGSRSAGLVAAVVAGPSPYMLGLLHSGLSEYIGLAAPTLLVWAGLSAMGLRPDGAAPSRRSEVAAAILLAISGLQALYYLVFGALFLACCVPGPGWRGRMGPLIRVGIASAVLSAPVLWLSLSSLGEGGAVGGDNAPGWTGRLPATDLQTFLRPGAWYFPDTPAVGNPGILHINYLGWVAVGLAVLAVVRGALPRATLRPGLIYGLFALGPRLAWSKRIVILGSMSVLLPLGLLYFPGSPLRQVHQPYRFVALLMPWLGIAAALGAARLPVWARGVAAALVLAETLWVSPAPWPVATRQIEVDLVQEGLEEGAVLDWPPDGSRLNRDYLVWQVRHGHPIPYGVNVFLGEDLRKDPLVDRLLRALEDLETRARNRDVPFQGRVLKKPHAGETQLGAMGFRYVIVHKSDLSDLEWSKTDALLRQALGRPAQEDHELALWAVPAP